MTARILAVAAFVLIAGTRRRRGEPQLLAGGGDANTTEGEVREAEASDRTWLAAFVLFVGGTLLQFVDAVVPDQ